MDRPIIVARVITKAEQDHIDAYMAALPFADRDRDIDRDDIRKERAS